MLTRSKTRATAHHNKNTQPHHPHTNNIDDTESDDDTDAVAYAKPDAPAHAHADDTESDDDADAAPTQP
jgi:hypothetical protein